MGAYKYLSQLWQEHDRKLLRHHLIAWRKEQSVTRLNYPTNLSRARSLGYKAKQGILVVRVRVHRGGRMREQIRAGRRSRAMRRVEIINKQYQWIAEERANKKYSNTEVLNSYLIAKDGRYYWFEVILVDKAHPQIKNDKYLSWITESQHTGRVYRGLTSAGKKSRGLLHKGAGTEKIRPSLRANKRKAH